MPSYKINKINEHWWLIFIKMANRTLKLCNIDKLGCTLHIHVATELKNIIFSV